MHEYSIVSALLQRVDTEARARQAVGVHRLTVRVGELSGLDRVLFETAFETFREGTVCADAALEVQSVPARWACTKCGLSVDKGGALKCGGCGAPARLAEGDEIILDRIDMEVP